MNVNYYNISKQKLIILSVLSCGTYNIYWFYKNWQSFDADEYVDVNSVARALFAPIYAYSLFKWVNQSLSQEGVKSYLSPVAIYLGYLTCHFVSYFATDIFPVFPSLAFLPLILVQDQINQLNTIRGENPIKKGLTKTDIFFILIGSLFWLLAWASYLSTENH